jgi:uncharacterized membrane protein HdeD (DUF308 family)
MEATVILRNWWSFALRGVIAIIFGIILLAWPAATLKVLITIIGILMLIDGFANMIRSAVLAGRKERWGWTLVEGLVGVLIGAIILAHMEFTVAFVAILAGIWVLILGIAQIALAFDLPPNTGRGILGVVGIISIAFGIVIVVYPFGSVYALTVLIGIYALVKGALDIVVSIYAWRLQREEKEEIAAEV